MDWLVFAGFLFGAAVLAYASGSKMLALQPPLRGLFVGTGLALVVIAGWLMAQQFGLTFGSKNIASMLFVFLSIVLYGSMIGFLLLRKVAGLLLFNVRRPLSRKVSGFITAGMFALLIVFTLLRAETSTDKVVEVVFYVAVVLYFASPFFGKVELRQHGIVETYALYRWKSISSYRWVGPQESNLMIDIRTPWRKTATVVLPPDQKESIDAVLRRQIDHPV
jgi:hypothetical protein